MRRIISFFLFALSVLSVIPVFGCEKKAENPSCSLDLFYDDERGIISGKAVYKFVNTANDVLNEVLFNLYPNAYNGKNSAVTERKKEKAYYAGESTGGIKIKSCSSSGEPLSFDLSNDELVLSVCSGDIFPNEEKQIEIEFETTLPKANLRLGITEKAINLADFYPALCKLSEKGFVPTGYSPFGSPYFSDATDFAVTLNVPSVFTAACSGYPEKTVVDGNRTEYSFSLENGRNFAFVLSDDFDVSAVKCGETGIYVYSFDKNDELIADVKKCFEYYSSAFGDYPYKTLSVVETGLWFGGTDFSGLCMISSDIPYETKRLAAYHETAHQWWGSGVGCDRANEAYVAEGLADYSVCLHLVSLGENDLANDIITRAKAAYKSFFDINKLFSGEADTSMNRPLKSFKTEEEFVAIAYFKSLIMFTELEKTTSAKKNVSAMKKLYSAHKFGFAGKAELENAFGHKEYFDSFVSGKVIV